MSNTRDARVRATGRRVTARIDGTTYYKRVGAPWSAEDFARDTDLYALDVEHAHDCSGPHPDYVSLGNRVDGRLAGKLECKECHAKLPLIDKLPLTAASTSGPKSVRREPIASPEEAEAAYREQGSDRKAASVLGMSRTHLRRLRGLED